MAQVTTSIDLRRSSVCTDNPTGSDLFPYNGDPTQFIQNTGIERNGGITSIYQQQTTFNTAGQSTMIAKDGTVIQVDSSNNVRLNDTVVGNVGPYAIYARGKVPSCLDAAWTADSTILMVNRAGTVFTISEYNPFTATVVNSRNVTFASFPSGTIVNLAFVRYVDMHYADNQEFVVSQGQAGQAQWWLKESGTAVATIASGVAFFAHRFSAGNYIWGINDNQTSWKGIGTFTTAATFSGTGDVGFVIIDRFPGSTNSRAILAVKNGYLASAAAAIIYQGSEGGYTYLGTFNTTAVPFAATLSAATVGQSAIYDKMNGFGYSEILFSLSTPGAGTIYTMSIPVMTHAPGTYYRWATIDSSTLMNGYGKLTDLYHNANSYIAWRLCFVNKVGSYISAAVPATGTSNYDCIGVPMTNVGEFDDTYTPHIDDNATNTYSRILYRSFGSFYFIDIRATINTVQRVSDGLYSVNCLSPFNAIDVNNKKLVTGATDYNGRMWFSAAASIAGSQKIVAQGEFPFANTVDFGDKLWTGAATVSVFSGITLAGGLGLPGIEVPYFIDRIPADWGINLFAGDVYVTTVLSSPSLPTAAFVYYDNPANSALTYIPDSRIPVGMGYTFKDKTAQTEIETIFTGVGVTGNADIDYDYLCYEIGNDISGLFQSFSLFGQIYIFDGKNIYLASFSGSLFSGRGNSPICPATGMTLIAVAPTEVYFLSSFDNSLYVFNGGRSLIKQKRLNDVDTISNGVYNVRDNTLLLNGTNHWIWLRDGIVSYNSKLATQTNVSLYDTQQGITIANNTTKWIYSYASLTNSTVVPLTWQSAYHSLRGNELSEAVNWVVSLYSPDGRIAAPVTLTCHSFDQDGYNKQVASLTVNPGDWDALGFVRTRIQPKSRKVLATSVQVDTTSHLVITDASIEYGDIGQARIAPARSK